MPRLLIFIVLLISLAVVPASAQTDFAGFYAYGAYHTSDFDTVDIGDFSLDLHIPLVSYPQRGRLPNLSLSIHRTNFYWTIRAVAHPGYSTTYYYAWSPYTAGQIYPIWDQSVSGAVARDRTVTPPIQAFRIIDSSGAQHILGTISPGVMETVDGSGYRQVGKTITDRNGLMYSLHNAYFMKDQNGNTITGYSFLPGVDSVGRNVPTPAAPLNPDFTPATGCVTTSFPGVNGGNYPMVFCYAAYAVASNFQTPGTQDISGTLVFLQSITLPNGTSWRFNYNSWGDLVSVGLPTGGTVSYTWAHPSPYNSGCGTVHAVVTSRSVDANDGTGPKTWTYGSPIPGTRLVTDPAGNDTVYTFVPASPTSCTTIQSRVQYYNGSSANASNLLKTVDTQYAISDLNPYQGLDHLSIPYSILPILTKTTLPNGQVSQTCLIYDNMANGPCAGSYVPGGAATFYNDNNNNYPPSVTYPFTYGSVVQKQEFDYGAGSPGNLLRSTNTQYQWQASGNYQTANLLALPATVTIRNGAGTQVAQTAYGYDENNGSPQGVLGNQTSTTRWLSTGNSPKTQYVYNVSGMRIKICNPIDLACANPTAYTYDSSGLFLSQIQYPTTSGISHIEQFNYDLNTGQLNWHKDQNNQQTSYGYDSMWRLTSVSYPDTGSDTYAYNDTFSYPNSPSFTLTKKINSNTNHVETGIVDGLGRPIQTKTIVPTSTCQTGYSYVSTTYDNEGRKFSLSNPYCTTGDTTYGLTKTYYDVLSRVTSVVEQDNSTVRTDYSNFPCITVTDEAGKKRKSCSDGLGRMTSVSEDPSGLNYQTSYTYDTLDNLLTVSQGSSRQRTFTYDSLSRLTNATNPESGAISYAYDANGNVLTKTDARGITINYSPSDLPIDPLNRIRKKTYSNGDPAVTFAYDGNTPVGCLPTLTITYGVGRRTGVCDAAGNEAWSYDKMGRVAQDQRTTNGVTKTTTYSTPTAPYNYDGSIAQLTYPSGRTIAYAPNSAAQPISAVDTANGINYATMALYSPHGALHSLINGNGTGILSTSYFNSRLQPCRIAINSTGTAPASCSDAANSGNVMDYTYDFHLTNANNGNVYKVINNRSGASDRNINYTYDSLNRISAAYTDGNLWGETYSIDQWGNLHGIGPYTGKPAGETLSQGVNGSNQLTNVCGANCYDSAGNLLNDGLNSYTYDAEGHTSTGAGVTYYYDGDGKRVRKSNGTLYWYGMGSDALDETDASGNLTSEYIFFGGKRIARRSPGSTMSLPVQNPSFETHNALDHPFSGGPYNYGPIPSWTITGSSGSWQPNSTAYTSLSDGSIVAYSGYNGTISQTLTGVSLQPNSTYTLKVAIGHRLDGYVGNYTIALQAGSTVLNSVGGSNSGIPSGTFADQTLTYTTGSSVISGNLGVVLSDAGTQVNYDNVRLSVSGSGDTISYYFADQLGTSRAIVQQGQTSPCYDQDFYPYGREVPHANEVPAFVNTCPQNYKFTGKERDSESGLDNFGARYDSSQYGRFMTPDPGNAGADPYNPQSWNMYAYVMNNPLSNTDPDGLCSKGTDDRMHDDDEGPCVEPKGTKVEVSATPEDQNTTSLNLPHGSSAPPAPPGQLPVTGRQLTQLTALQQPQNQSATKTCSGDARVLQGNANLIGKPGGFSTPNKNVPVTANGAAIIPRQWGGAAALRPNLDQISGTFPNANASFQGVVDTIGSTQIPNVQDYLMQEYPGKTIIELPGSPRDLGVTQGVFTVPATMSCPAGTTQAP